MHAIARIGSIHLLQLVIDLHGVGGINFCVATYVTGFTPLHVAAFHGQLNFLQYLLEALPDNYDLNFALVPGNTTLDVAVDQGNFDIVQLLLSRGALIEGHGYSALISAAYTGNFEAVQYLCEQGAAVNFTTAAGYTTLHMAARRGQLEVVGYLLKKNKSLEVSHQTEVGQTPLDLAINFPNIVRVLFAHGAGGNRVFEETSSTLCLVIHSGRWDVFDILTEHGADVNARFTVAYYDWNFVATPLTMAAMCGELDILADLCEREVDLQGVTDHKETVLHIAARGKFGIVEYLVEDQEIDVNCESELGFTPANVAKFHGKADVLESLLDHGARAPRGGIISDDEYREIEEGERVVEPTEDYRVGIAYWRRHYSFERFIDESEVQNAAAGDFA